MSCADVEALMKELGHELRLRSPTAVRTRARTAAHVHRATRTTTLQPARAGGCGASEDWGEVNQGQGRHGEVQQNETGKWRIVKPGLPMESWREEDVAGTLGLKGPNDPPGYEA